MIVLEREKCVDLYIYSDGFYSRKPIPELKPWAILSFCGDRGEKVVVRVDGESQTLDFRDCIGELKESSDGGQLVPHDKLFDRLDRLVEKCNGVEGLEAALTLYFSEYKLEKGKNILEVLRG